jgi:hypothetical protein
MAKTTKKSKPIIKPDSKKMPPINEGDSTFVLEADEVNSLIQILAFSKELFLQMSINAANIQDEKTRVVFAARSELSGMLYRKFREIASIGEPTSRELH